MRLFHDRLEGRHAGFDAAGDARVELAGGRVEMCGAARDPDFHVAAAASALFVKAVSYKVGAATRHAKKGGGEALDGDGGVVVRGAWDCDGFAVLGAEDVEEVLVDAGCDDFREG